MRIGDFRKWLADEEAKWNADPMNDQVMGKFEDQEILVPVFEWNREDRYASDGAFDYRGLGPDLLVYWDATGLGLVIDHNDFKELEPSGT
jgi:hypothetical protein